MTLIPLFGHFSLFAFFREIIRKISKSYENSWSRKKSGNALKCAKLLSEKNSGLFNPYPFPNDLSHIHFFLSSFLPSFLLSCHSSSCIHSFIHSSIHSFINSFIHHFIHSSIHSFINSFIYSLIPYQEGQKQGMAEAGQK